MYYQDKTYEKIKQRVLSRITLPIDKREGSFVNDMVSPYSLEMEDFYAEFPYLLGTMFLVDSDSEELEKRGNEYGIFRKEALQSIGYVYITPKNLPCIIKKGTVVATNTNILFAIEEDLIFKDLVEMKVKIKAINYGSRCNIEENTIVKFVENVNASVINKEKTSGGVDRETDKELLERILFKIQHPSTGGNKNDYRNWTLEVQGVGDAKIFPLAYGNGTVKILAISNNKTPLDPVIMQNIENNIEKKKPVFGKVYVETPVSLLLNIDAKISLEQGYTTEYVKVEFSKKFSSYINSLILKKYNIDYLYVISLLYSIEGVSKISELKLNNDSKDIKIEENQIPQVGTIDIRG